MTQPFSSPYPLNVQGRLKGWIPYLLLFLEWWCDLNELDFRQLDRKTLLSLCDLFQKCHTGNPIVDYFLIYCSCWRTVVCTWRTCSRNQFPWKYESKSYMAIIYWFKCIETEAIEFFAWIIIFHQAEIEILCQCYKTIGYRIFGNGILGYNGCVRCGRTGDQINWNTRNCR